MTEHRFTKGMRDYAPGMLALVRSRIEEHRKKFGGREPLQLLMHGATFRQLIEEHAKEYDIDLSVLPFPVEAMGGCQLDEIGSIPIMRCRCTTPMAQDLLFACDGTHEEL